jgi:signal transduction histidine kinase
MTARVARVLAVLTFVLVVADTVVTAQYRSLVSEDTVAAHGFPFVDLAVLGCAVLGALILSQHHRHPVGLLFSVIGFTSSVSLLAEAYSIWVVTEDGPGPSTLGSISGWVASLFGGQLAITGLALMFLVIPDGRLLSPRWRIPVVITLLGTVSCLAGILSQDPRDYDLLALAEETPVATSVLLSVGFLLISFGLLTSAASMVIRLRRSRGEERQQMRLIAVSSGLLALGLVFLLVVQLLNGGQQTWLASIPLYASYTLLPVRFGVAVLRYRLYDVVVILIRTLVVVLGTAFAAAGYTTLVVLVGHRVGQGTEGVWLSLLATAVVAVAFQPLRRQVIRLANRLAYGSRAAPYEALADFSRRIADAPTADTLLLAVAEAAGSAVSAPGAAAVLHARDSLPLTAVWGTPGADDAAYDVPVHLGKDELGSIRVWSGQTRRDSDVRLLEALADQTAVVFRNVGLQAELAAHVAELDGTTEELARSRSRIIEADDAARRTMEAAISREVLPHLASVPAGIARAREANAAGVATSELDDLVATTNTALEALRDLTRGLFPTQLARSGLEPALRSHLARSGLAGTLRVDPAVAGRRVLHAVEAAVYQCLVGAVREHEHVSAIGLALEGDDLVVHVHGHRHDDADLQAVVDRAEAVGGSVVIAPGELAIRLPAELEVEVLVAD